MTGLFITFEGGDGSGKSTQLALLVQWLEESGQAVLVTREPGGTDLGNELRDLVLHRRGEMVPWAEALIYAADRAQHIAMAVRPALDRGEVVVQDRYLDSSVAYQGVGRQLGADAVRQVSLLAAGGLLPDLTVLLDLDESTARQRMGKRTKFDRLEAEKTDFHATVRAAYLALADEEPERFLVVDASEPVNLIAEIIQARVQDLLATR